MIRRVIRWLDSPWAYELLPGLNKLGRNPTNDFRISDPSVSSFHAEIQVDEETIRVRDLGSTNGTFIDEGKITEAELKPEHTLRLGSIRLKLDEVAVADIQAPTEKAEPSAPAPAPMCIYHDEVRATFKCENCGATLCDRCLKVIGQGKFEATTVCPVCQGQCHLLPHEAKPESQPSLLHRLTRTLRLPFSR